MDSRMTLQDMNIVVTGAGQGIGRSVAEVAHSLGASLTLVDLNDKTMAEVAEGLDKSRVLCIAGDVADPALAERVVSGSVTRFGAIHGLVNNAGVVKAAMIEKMTREQWQKSLDVNLSGAFYFLQAVGRHMIADAKTGSRRERSIVNISSDAGRRGTIGQINYGATKAGLFSLSMSAAREWAKYGIRVNTLAPGGVIVTPMTETIRSEKFRDKMLDMVPMGRFGNPDEIAWPVCFLMTAAASFITGQSLGVNGGFHMNVG